MARTFCPAHPPHSHRLSPSSSPHFNPVPRKHMKQHPKHCIALVKQHRHHHKHHHPMLLHKFRKRLHKLHSHHGGGSFRFLQPGHHKEQLIYHARFCCLHSAGGAAGAPAPCCPGKNMIDFDDLSAVSAPCRRRRSRIHSHDCRWCSRNGRTVCPGQPIAPPEPAASPPQPVETDREGARVVSPPVVDMTPVDEGQNEDEGGPSNA